MEDGNKLSGLVLLWELGNKDVNTELTQPFIFLRQINQAPWGLSCLSLADKTSKNGEPGWAIKRDRSRSYKISSQISRPKQFRHAPMTVLTSELWDLGQTFLQISWNWKIPGRFPILPAAPRRCHKHWFSSSDVSVFLSRAQLEQWSSETAEKIKVIRKNGLCF